MTGLEPLLLTAGMSAGTAATVAGTIGTIASIGSTLFSMQASKQESAAEIASTRYNAAIEATEAAKTESKLRREQYLRAGSQLAAGGAQGRGLSGNVLDIMADTLSQSEEDILGLRVSSKMAQDLAKNKVSQIKKSSSLSTGASILSGVSKFAGGKVI